MTAEIDHPRAQASYTRHQIKVASKRLAAIHFSLTKHYDVQLAAEAIALTKRVTDLEVTLKMLASDVDQR